jgi:exodeoxyribonuclease-1
MNPKPTYYFYDLETSGLNPRLDRIMQFAGQRTDLDFNPIGEPDNILVALADDTLPSPGAIMVTGITPQSTRQDGLTEREFCEFLLEKVATPNTTIMGYNSVRFDDEFVRHTLWRNFHDPYEWQWKDGRSRWDLLDVVRLTRALRPEGINWPVTPEGRPTNRLELITKENNISHEHAHDALSDVCALIAVTKLIHDKQPQLFDFLYKHRNKRDVADLVNLDNPQPFVYATGRYPSATCHTSVAYPFASADNGNVLVFDLRYNLDELLKGEADAKAAGTLDFKKPFHERDPWERGFQPIVKKLQYNHCPAVAPLGVLEKSVPASSYQVPAGPTKSAAETAELARTGWQKIDLTLDQVQKNLKSLLAHPEFIERMAKVKRPDYPPSVDPESALYDGFLDDHDRLLCSTVRSNGADDLADYHPHFLDDRLPELLLHYKAKNYPSALAGDEIEKWEAYRTKRLADQSPRFLEELQKIQQTLGRGGSWGSRSPEDCAYLLEELHLWYESIQPADY